MVVMGALEEGSEEVIGTLEDSLEDSTVDDSGMGSEEENSITVTG
jgi:hypothetical protein